jgi:hypothetical protein
MKLTPHKKVTKQYAKHLFDERGWLKRTRYGSSGDTQYMTLAFDSLRHYVMECEQLGLGQIPGSNGSKWTYGESAPDRETTYRMALSGIASDKLKELVVEIEEHVRSLVMPRLNNRKSAKPRRAWSMAGGNLDYGKYFSGDPDCFRKVKQGAKKKTVRIGLTYNCSCGNDEESFAKVVALAAATAKILEKVGYATEILGHCTLTGGGARNQASIHFPLKKAGQRFDLEKIASLAYPGVFRDFTFGVLDAIQHYHGGENGKHQIGNGNGYGHNYEADAEILDLIGCQANVSRAWTRDGDKQLEFIETVLDDVGI